MASLQKTATRDLSTAIAGKIWEAIKDADERRQLDKKKASEDVKKAAVKLKKDDPNSLPVQDKDLGETVVRIFGPLEGKLLQTEGKVENLSGKITAVAGSVSDTQKLIINQNQLLEDKFDKMLNIVGERAAIKKQKEAEDKFEQLEMNLEGAMDLSKTFGYEKASGRSGFGVLGAILSNVIGRRLTRRLTRNLYKSIVPKGLQARARLLSRSLRPFRKVARVASRGTRGITSAVLMPFVKKALLRFGKQQWFRQAFKFGQLGVKTSRMIAGKGAYRSPLLRSNRFFRHGLGNVFNRMRLFRATGTFNADRVAQIFIDEMDRMRIMDDITAANLRNQGRIKAKSLTSLTGTTAEDITSRIAGKGVRKITKKATTEALEKSARRGGSAAASELTETALSKPLVNVLKNPIIWNKISKKMGPEFMEKMAVRLGVGGFKSVGVGPGTAYAFGEGLVRLSPAFGGSDPTGMLMSFGSAIPWAGWGVTIMDILRDIDREAFDQYILPNMFALDDATIANYFKAALDIDTPQFERGNVNITGDMGGTASSISEILSVTKAFGDAAGFSGEVQGQIDAAGLSSYPIPKGNYHFDVGGRGSLSGVIEKGKEEEKELKKAEKEEDKRALLLKLQQEEEAKNNNNNKDNNTNNDVNPKEEGGSKWYNPFSWGTNGGGGIGGDDNVQARTPIMGGDGATIEFWGQQGRDLSGEPGVDFSYKDYKSNYNLFPGYVLETGLLYGNRYGNVVVVRSVDPSNGLEFDSLYSHFPDGGIAVQAGQIVSAGEYLGKVGFVSVDTPGVPQMQPNNAGNMSGWHTSVDFFEPGSSARYRNLSVIQSLITGADGQSPVGLLEQLKPPTTTNDDQSSLNNIEANSKISSTMTGMVENGSMERQMTKRNSLKRSPIVIVNNQIIKTSTNSISLNTNNQSGDFFEAYNLARYTV